MEDQTRETTDENIATKYAPAKGSSWDDLESRFYMYLTDHEQIGRGAQKHIFACYAQQFQRGQKVLDVGSGPGDFLDLLNTQGVSGFGLDADPGMIAESRRRGHTVFADDAVHFLQTTKRRFDGVFMGNFIEHFPAQQVLALIKGAHRVLRPSGRLMIATPDPRSLHVHLQEFWRDATHIRLYDRDLIAFLVETSGFHALEICSNAETEYNPGDLWFGQTFTERLAKISQQPMSAHDPQTTITREPTGTTHAPTAFTSAADAPLDALAPPLRDVSLMMQEQRRRIDDLEQRLLRLTDAAVLPQQTVATTARATQEHMWDAQMTPHPQETAASEASTNEQPHAADSRAPIMRAERDVAASVAERPPEDALRAGYIAASLEAPVPLIPERRSVANLRQWIAQYSESREPMIPRQYRRPHVPGPEAAGIHLITDLMMNLRDEVRSVAATSRAHERALCGIEKRLMNLGEVVGMTQEEATLVVQAVRQRIHALEQTWARLSGGVADLLSEVDASRAEVRELRDSVQLALSQITTEAQTRDAEVRELRDSVQLALSQITTEAQTRDAEVRELRDSVQLALSQITTEAQTRENVIAVICQQLVAFFAFLSPPREYYVIATRLPAPTRRDG